MHQFERRVWTFREIPELKVSESRLSSRRRVPPHIHRHDVLNVLLSGRQDMVEEMGGREFRVEEGGVSILARGSVLSGKVVGHCLSLALPVHWGLIHGGVPVRRRITSLASTLERQGRKCDDDFESRALLLAASRLREANPHLVYPVRRSFSEQAEEALRSVFEEIESNFHRKLSLERLADEVGWHPHYLQKLFRKRFGLSPARFQQQLRAERALELLRLGHSGAETAQLLGYCDQSHLIRSFRNFHGVSPSEIESRSSKPCLNFEVKLSL